jgi:ribosomal protein L35
MKNSVTNRIKITKSGKLMRRPMGQNHFKAKKTGKQNRMKRGVLAFHASDLRAIKRYGVN